MYAEDIFGLVVLIVLVLCCMAGLVFLAVRDNTKTNICYAAGYQFFETVNRRGYCVRYSGNGIDSVEGVTVDFAERLIDEN